MEFIYEALGCKWSCFLIKRTYSNGRIGILLQDNNPEDQSPIATVTVNIPGIYLEDDEIIVKDYTENKGMANWLAKNGLAEFIGKSAHSGYITAPIMKLTQKAKECLKIC
jgi:hypothetical protein